MNETNVSGEGAQLAGDGGQEPRRLHRSRTHVIGGVAAGLAERFDLDVAVVRVVFVVLGALWGFGVVVYLAMWAILPEGEGTPPATSPSRWRKVGLVALFGLALALFVATVGRVPRFGSGALGFWLLVFVVAIVALRVERHARLGRIVVTTLLGVLVALLLAAGAFLALVATSGVPMTGGIGVRAWQPTSRAHTLHAYRNGFGRSVVDLSGVTFPRSGFRVVASVAAGELVIDVPSDAVVDVRTHVGVGSVNYEASGGFPGIPFASVPRGLVGAARTKAPHLVVDASVGVGHLVIVRGPQP